MKNEIVVGLDDSPSSKAALDWAAEQARGVGTVLRAVHVLDWPYGLSSAGFPAPADFKELTHEEIEDSYRQAITAVFDAVSPSPDWTLQFASGDAGQILVRQSDGARLLVLGTREYVGLGRLLTGSVSHYCLSHASCPVVAVPAPSFDRAAVPDAAELATTNARTEQEQDVAAAIQVEEGMIQEPPAAGTTLVVAGVDASAESLAAAHYAVKAAELRGGEVVLVHAFKPPSTRVGDKEQALSEARMVAERLLAAIVAQLVIPPRVRVSMKAEPADAVEAVEKYAHEAAMLVLGRDNVSWIERLFLGAVTSRVVDQIPCPLVVVPGNWRSRYARPRLPVIVALDLDTAPEPALQLAFEEARLRDARLVVLHAQPTSASDQEADAAQFDLDSVLAEWQQNHPEVAVSTSIVSGDADDQLVRWSRWAAVLIVGHPHRRSWEDWTRSVARAVMRQTHGALMVAPEFVGEPGRYWGLPGQAQT
jgi:nucleotide-binding universal stress UspA family protein